MGLVRRHLERHTYGDYLAWPEDGRYELIDGVAYAMRPTPTVSHQEVLLALSRQIDEVLDESACRVLIAPLDVRPQRGDEAGEAVDTVVQPDFWWYATPPGSTSAACAARRTGSSRCSHPLPPRMTK